MKKSDRLVCTWLRSDGAVVSTIRTSSAALTCTVLCCLSGIVDVLQMYNAKKASESFFKSLVHSKAEISAVEPHLYAKRFVKFIDAHTM